MKGIIRFLQCPRLNHWYITILYCEAVLIQACGVTVTAIEILHIHFSYCCFGTKKCEKGANCIISSRDLGYQLQNPPGLKTKRSNKNGTVPACLKKLPNANVIGNI
jgi:hypothetical protein